MGDYHELFPGDGVEAVIADPDTGTCTYYMTSGAIYGIAAPNVLLDPIPMEILEDTDVLTEEAYNVPSAADFDLEAFAEIEEALLEDFIDGDLTSAMELDGDDLGGFSLFIFETMKKDDIDGEV